MSIKLMSAIFETEFFDMKDENGNVTKGSTAKLVLLALADHANDEGEGAYPGLTKMERKTCLSRQCIIDTYNTLKFNGIIALMGISKMKTNNYTVNIQSFPRTFDESKARLLVNPVDQPSQPGLPVVVNPVDSNHPITTIEPPSDLSQIKEKANRKVDAILDQERNALNKVNYPKREALPEPIRELIDEFVQTSGLKPLAKEVSHWLMAGQDWLNLGATKEDVRGALQYAKGKFTITDPGSLTKTLRSYKTGNVALTPSEQAELNSPAYKPYIPQPDDPNAITYAEWKKQKESKA